MKHCFSNASWTHIEDDGNLCVNLRWHQYYLLWLTWSFPACLMKKVSGQKQANYSLKGLTEKERRAKMIEIQRRLEYSAIQGPFWCGRAGVVSSLSTRWTTRWHCCCRTIWVWEPKGDPRDVASTVDGIREFWARWNLANQLQSRC